MLIGLIVEMEMKEAPLEVLKYSLDQTRNYDYIIEQIKNLTKNIFIAYFLLLM